MSTLNPRIFVACQSAHDAGFTFGHWISATDSLEDVEHKINNMLSLSPFPDKGKYLISDSLDFGAIEPSEYDLEDVVAIAHFIQEHGSLGAAVLEYERCDVDVAQATLDDNYQGAFDSELEFATQLFEDCYTAPEPFDRYIDYDKFARDLFSSGDYYSIQIEDSYKHHIFSSN